MKTETLNALIEKAKTKKDGLYSFRGHPYAVKNGWVQLIGDFNKVLQVSHGFLVDIGIVVSSHQLKGEIKRLYKQL